jgi:aminopeptidase N
VDVLHYDLEVGLSDTASWIEGQARIRAVVDDPPGGVVALDFTGLSVKEVTLDGSPALYTQDPGHIRVGLPEGTAPGDTVVVAVSYRGSPRDGLDIQRTVHGEPAAFADNWPNRARFWFPSIDHPSDKATVSFTVHAPAAWDVVANGYLAEPPAPSPPDAMGPPGHRRTWRWEQTVPIPTYTIVLGATRFARTLQERAACGQAPAAPRADGCIEVSYWAFPPDTAHASRTFRRSPEIVDYFTELVGPYPYEKLANVQSATRFGGMENATAIFYDQHSLAQGRDMESTLVHEIVHMWFGNSVTAADWHHIWLSEGFATYFTAVFYQHHEGEGAFREIMEAARRQIVASPSSRRPVVDSTYTNLFDLLNTNSYQEGGWILHMLRGVVGDDAFFSGIRRYYREHRNGTARTSDLQAILEEEVAGGGRPRAPTSVAVAAGIGAAPEAGLDTEAGNEIGLDTFFRQWLLQPGFPMLRGGWTWDSDRSEAVVTVTQEQPTEWPTFHFDLEVELATPAGPVRATLPVRSRGETLRVPVPGRPNGLTLDPNGWLLHGEALQRLFPGRIVKPPSIPEPIGKAHPLGAAKRRKGL